jgi:hypothetical protein
MIFSRKGIMVSDEVDCQEFMLKAKEGLSKKKSNRGTGKDELTVEICGAQFFTQDVPFPFGFKSSTMCPGY